MGRVYTPPPPASGRLAQHRDLRGSALLPEMTSRCYGSSAARTQSGPQAIVQITASFLEAQLQEGPEIRPLTSSIGPILLSFCVIQRGWSSCLVHFIATGQLEKATPWRHFPVERSGLADRERRPAFPLDFFLLNHP